jgi:hypothetical protein
MRPEQLAASGTEEAHQIALFARVAIAVAEQPAKYQKLKWLYHVPNGGSRGSSLAERSRNGGRMRALGAKSGVADICLPVACQGQHGLYIEMKNTKGGVLSPEQKDFMAFVRAEGYAFAVCTTWQEAWELIDNYLGEQA